MIKLFGSDLDGTLLKNHVCDAYISSRLNELLEKKACIALATGRNQRNAFSANVPCSHTVCLNGALIYDQNRNPIAWHAIDSGIVAKMLNELEDLPLEFNCLQGTFTTWSKEAFMAAHKSGELLDFGDDQDGAASFFSAHHFSCTKEQILEKDVLKVEMICGDQKLKDKLNAFLADHDHELTNAGSYAWVHEITAAGVSKAQGLLELASLLNILPDEVAVYGDGGNDVDMLKTFAHSYCPADGQQPALQAASQIIGAHDTYAVVDHMCSTFFSSK